jgi:hypothetical protein
MKKLLFIISLFLIPGISAIAQSANNSLEGTWKGRTICLVKSAGCTDELSVYHISRGKKPGTYSITIKKVVDGKEEEMHKFEYTYSNDALSYADKKRDISISFDVKGNVMEGNFTSKGISRLVALKKEN